MKQKWGEGIDNASQAREETKKHVTSIAKEIECKELFEKRRGNHNETIEGKENMQKEARIIVRDEIIEAYTLQTQYIHVHLHKFSTEFFSVSFASLISFLLNLSKSFF